MGTSHPSVAERLRKAPRIALINELAWQKFKKEAVNEEAAYAERWARLMQLHMARGERLEDVVEATLRDVQEELIMRCFGQDTEYNRIDIFNTCAFLSLTQYWKYGEQLKCWHEREGYKYFSWMLNETSDNSNRLVSILVLFKRF